MQSSPQEPGAGYVTCLIWITYAFLVDERSEPRS